MQPELSRPSAPARRTRWATYARSAGRAVSWLIAIGCVLFGADAAPADTVVIASPGRPTPVVRLAAEELAHYLGRIHPQTRFVTRSRLPGTGPAILVGSDPSVRSLVPEADLSQAESYAVCQVRRGDQELGIIAGADPRGVVYGVYALLEKLGCGFYLSYETLPPARMEPFSMKYWALSNAPLARDRLVFDWHNFLSGCSTWNLDDWNRWTEQSQKMGYNGIMVHAYGNNPMVSFTFNGKTKPVGYLSTTVQGRDWSTMHVNDVRRLFGGEVFRTPVFGADAAQVGSRQRAPAAQTLMRAVFAHAQARGMDVYFATDIDTGSANPQELILTLPERARFAVQTRAGGLTGVRGEGDSQFWLADPDTPEGDRYYHAQAAALMKAYPQITTLVLWFRQGGTPWTEAKVAEMPASWQHEWRAEIARTPEAETLWHAPQVFAMGKIVRAFDRALRKLGRERVQLAAGTWDFKFLAPCHRFFPPRVKLIGLDYNVLHNHPQLAEAASRRVLSEVAAHRPVIPVIWAHHDDGNYIGRPYTPFTEFSARLADAKACGFGIIHWTTRPLDLFFKSHAEQVWSATRDRPLRATCDDMAARSFGPGARELMGEYLEHWVTEAPKFARETSDLFIDRPLTNIAQVVRGCRDRLELIERVNPGSLTLSQRDRLEYFQGLERFIAAFHLAHGQFQQAQARVKTRDPAGARAALAECDPAKVIQQFAQFSSFGGMTRGEQGLVVSLNTRWLPHIVRLRQQLAAEPIRYRFGPTSHDPLAQAPGRFTFHFDAEHRLWQTLGTQETGAAMFTARGAEDELCRSGIESDRPITLAMRPILSGKSDASALPAGDYRVRLLLLDPTSNRAGQRVFRVTLNGAAVEDALDIFALSGGRDRVLERAWPVRLVEPGQVVVTLTPIAGKASLCAAVLEAE